ncbi:hypothetical protein D3C73_1593600 [compost metagenome]
MQLAGERGFHGLAWLELAAGEFPVALVRLARGALRQQEAAVGLHHHADGDFGDLARRVAGGLCGLVHRRAHAFSLPGTSAI